ncbi:uncharacterized protein LOC131433917 [Malaya genurostris]|uniref:uncharacterized protein LOC131433917 n=1 Tax=Malaya genurostris TaxID=325434 RepID=UPI0026F3DE11|nr:uncharacterized protein LOC131433917 [Malaya genurostris]
MEDSEAGITAKAREATGASGLTKCAEGKRGLSKMQFGFHKGVSTVDYVDYACEKSAKAMNAIGRIIPNVGGPRSSTRRLIASISSSILRYRVPAWSAALEIKRNREKLNNAFRLMAMRVSSAYRTISSETVCVIAGMIPICITLKEDIECYQQRDTRNARKIVRIRSMARWQLEWDETETGRWTHRLIPNLSTWVDRKHGEFLSGHGLLQEVLTSVRARNFTVMPGVR